MILLSFISLSGFSQSGYKYVYNDSIVVTKNGTVLQNAWAGGVNSPQIGKVDVNFDCYLDIVLFDRATNQFRVYVNDTTSHLDSYHYAPEYAAYFPKGIEEFVVFRDYNKDGKTDLFTHTPGGMKLYTNVSDNTLKFELTTPLLVTKSSGQVFTVVVDYPCIDDIDGDGDLDILSTHQFGTFISYYQNVSPTLDTMIFEMDPSCWGNFYENVQTDSIVLNYNCKGGGASSGGAQRHTGGTITTIDLTGNGVKDLLSGDVGYSNLLMLHNGGTNTAAHMTSVDYNYPGSTNVAVNLPTFPTAFFEDVNNDNRNDLLITVNDKYTGSDTGNIWMYENYGANNQPNFQLAKKNFLVGEQIDVGSIAFPVLADISGDNIPDLMIGNFGYFESYDYVTSLTTYRSQIAYYKNTGTAANPAFELVTNDLANISTTGRHWIAPAFADIDGDGDNDLLCGETNGKLSYYQNMGGSGAAPNFVLVTDNFMNQSFGLQPSPFLFDIDKDSKLDLLVGQKNGNIKLYLNQGTTTNPIYDTAITDTLGGIYHYFPGYHNNAAPYIGKLRGDTTNVLLVGDGDGVLHFYEGMDANYLGTYTETDSLKLSTSIICATGANLNANDSIELIVGEHTGGVMYLNLNETKFDYKPYPRDSCGQNIPDGIGEIHSEKSLFEVYPNPSNGNFDILFKTVVRGAGFISITDLSGKTIATQSVNVQDISIPVSFRSTHLNAGIYIIQIQVGKTILRDKIVIQ